MQCECTGEVPSIDALTEAVGRSIDVPIPFGVTAPVAAVSGCRDAMHVTYQAY